MNKYSILKNKGKRERNIKETTEWDKEEGYVKSKENIFYFIYYTYLFKIFIILYVNNIYLYKVNCITWNMNLYLS